MMRYLRGKGFLDVLGDGIQWLVPGRTGKALKIAIMLPLTLALAILMCVVNYRAIARWF